MERLKGSNPIVTKLQKFEQTNGIVMHGLKGTESSYVGFGEAYFSSVDFQKIKGWKLHKRMTLNLIVACGEIRFIVHAGEEKKGSREVNPILDVVMGDSNHSRLTVPPGFWLAFQGVGSGKNILLNIASIEHDSEESINVSLDSFNVNNF